MNDKLQIQRMRTVKQLYPPHEPMGYVSNLHYNKNLLLQLVLGCKYTNSSSYSQKVILLGRLSHILTK